MSEPLKNLFTPEVVAKLDQRAAEIEAGNFKEIDLEQLANHKLVPKAEKPTQS